MYRIKSLIIQSLILYFYLFCGINFISGQTLSFDNFLVEDGISQSEIKCIHQDAEGYIWIGTQNGLNKFDGYVFEKYFYDPSDDNSISNNWIFDIAEDPEGNIWLGTKGGLNKYDKKTGQFYLVNYKDTNSIIEDNFVYGLAADETSIYINTPPIVTILNYRTEEFETFITDFDYDGAVYDIKSPIIKDRDSLIWVGSYQGLSSFDVQEKRFSYIVHDNSDQNSISHDHITALYEDKQGNIVIGTENGMNFYNKKKNQIKRYSPMDNESANLSHDIIHSIIQDHTGAIWIGTEGSGLNKLIIKKEGTDELYQFRSGAGIRNAISHDIVYSLFEDNSFNLWIGTITGLDKTDLKKKNFRTYKKSDDPNSIDLLDNVIASVYKDKSGNLWIGNWGSGLNILDRSTNVVVHYSSDFPWQMNIPENHVHAIFEDSESLIWLGTRDGVCIFNEKTNQFIAVQDYFGTGEFDIFDNNRVYCIIEARDGKIWIGTGNGINILDKSTKQVSSLKAAGEGPLQISSNLVYSLLEDRDRNVWIATSDGLDRFIPEEKKIYHYVHNPASANTLIDNFTISLCEDYLGNIWIGTSSGVNIFHKPDSAFTYYSINDGLPSNIIYDIIEDNKNNLWFATGSGLAMIHPGKETSNNFVVIDELQGKEFNLNAVFKSEDGELFFGGMDGMVSFYPDSIRNNNYLPPIRITSFVKESEGIRKSLNVYTDEIELSHKEYSFTIEFSALDFTNPSKNRYTYQMEGISDQWEYIGARRFVHFTNLPPKYYTFNVKGTNNDGVWSDSTASIKIRILPPWWRSNYAYGSYLILGIILIVLIIKRRERKLIQEKRKLEKKVSERTAEIALQKEKVEEQREELKDLNATKDKFFSILAHDLKNPFSNLYSMSELISENYESLDEAEKVIMLKNINKSTEFIYNLLENLLTWSKSQRGRIEYNPTKFSLTNLIQENINLHRVPAENKGVSIQSGLKDDIQAYGDREMINTVMRNLINNAVKFTDKGGSVEVSANELDGFIEVHVKDKGVGISPENLQKLFHIDVKFKSTGTEGETGTGLGLILCKEFVEKNGGSIRVESEEGSGSSFIFTIPENKSK